jgi:isoamylase
LAATSSRSQSGNKNAYRQDYELTWFDWNAVAQNSDLIRVTTRLYRPRQAHAVFRRRQFFRGRAGGRARP